MSHSDLTCETQALTEGLDKAVFALIDIRDSSAYDIAAKARASLALADLGVGCAFEYAQHSCRLSSITTSRLQPVSLRPEDA